jgi:MFS family permease
MQEETGPREVLLDVARTSVPGVVSAGPVEDSDGYSLSPGRRSALMGSLLINNLVLFATYAGVIAILLPAQVAEIDPVNKVANFAIVTSASAFATLFVQPIVGALSDRTRSRFGRRSPWIILGGVGGGLCTIALQFASVIPVIAFVWVLAQVLLNALQGPTAAIIADRVETGRRGSASAFQGVGTAVGIAAGVTFAGSQLAHLGVAYTVFGLALMIMAVLFVLANPDRSSAHIPREPLRWGAFFRGFWISPRRHPDYAWAFAGRFFMVLGYQAIQNYTFYILTDYVHLSPADAGALFGVMSMITAGTMVFGTLLFGKLSDLLRRRKLFVFAATILMAIAIAIPLVAPSVGAMLAYSVVVGIGYGAYMAVDLALMIDVLPSKGDIGKDLGVLNVASNVPQTITPLIAAAMLGLFGGNYASIFIYAIVAVVLSSVLVFPIKKVR